MALITVDQLNEFVENTEDLDIKITIVASADEVVTDYLGYDPASAERVYRFVGLDNDSIILPIPGASAITSVVIDGQTLDSGDYELDTEENEIRCLNDKYFIREKNVVITYTAGFSTIPPKIVHAALRIAGLMWSEAHGNIGITSKSFADMSRSFVSYTNYSKYLLPLSKLRKGEL